MGLYDGISGDNDNGSTAQIAKILGLPVILVIDASRMARSVAPLIKGFIEFDPQLQFGGIIFNRVGSAKHRQILIDATKSVTNIGVLGFIEKNLSLSFPERHLGLLPFYENLEFQTKLAGFADSFGNNININLLLGILENKKLQGKPVRGVLEKPPPANSIKAPPQTVRIGIARDEAFGFYYQDNIRSLQRAGAELLPFSPLKDKKLPPDLDGLYIGGGYPELFSEQLSNNKQLRAELKAVISNGLPTYAECGGLMYLAERIQTTAGIFPMVGVLKLTVEMTCRREALGYSEVTAASDNLLLKTGQVARGHEFHYSKIIESQVRAGAYLLKKSGIVVEDGYVTGNILASYIHLHFASNAGMARRFVTKCREYRDGV
jgi:cobyrinic acid a,c-diamide synthase